jgi:FkbM family methyltransferase
MPERAATRAPAEPGRGGIAAIGGLRLSGVRRVVDVGAHFGESAGLLARMFVDAEIHAFEPSASSFAELSARCREEKRVIPHCEALGDEPGTSQLFTHERSETNSLLADGPSLAAYGTSTGVEPVRISRLDDRWPALSSLPVDILKVDVQGFDHRVLRGARGVLGSCRVLLVEVVFAPLYAHQGSFAEIFSIATEAGLRLQGLHDIETNRSGVMDWCDALFVRV